MKHDVSITIDGKNVALRVLEASAGLDVVDVRGLINEGLFTFDPGFLSTASCESKITYIDGDAGVLTYRGYVFDKDAPTDHKSQVDGYVDPQEAGHAAANQLFADFPDTAKKCGAAEKQFVQPALNVTSFLTGKFKRIVAQV